MAYGPVATIWKDHGTAKGLHHVVAAIPRAGCFRRAGTDDEEDAEAVSRGHSRATHPVAPSSADAGADGFTKGSEATSGRGRPRRGPSIRLLTRRIRGGPTGPSIAFTVRFTDERKHVWGTAVLFPDRAMDRWYLYFAAPMKEPNRCLCESWAIDRARCHGGGSGRADVSDHSFEGKAILLGSWTAGY